MGCIILKSQKTQRIKTETLPTPACGRNGFLQFSVHGSDFKSQSCKVAVFSYKTVLGYPPGNESTSHLGKRKIVFKMVWGILVPRRVLALPFWLWYWIWVPIFGCLFFHANNFCRAMFSPPLRRQVGFYVHQLGWKLRWLYPLKFVGHEGW